MGRWKITAYLALGLLAPLSYASAETITSPFFYAWSNNVGYISFAQTTVSDSGLGGFAWSTNTGWINMAPAIGGVHNDGRGNLSGSAWGEGLGWIDFSGVRIADGKFTGTATGDLAGTITFDCPNFCDVRTDWVPKPAQAVRPASGNGNEFHGSTQISTSTIVENVGTVPTTATPQGTAPAQSAGAQSGSPESQVPFFPSTGRSSLSGAASESIQSNTPFSAILFSRPARYWGIAIVVGLLAVIGYALAKRRGREKNTPV